MLVVADAAAPAKTFDGGGSLGLGEGWGGVERGGDTDDWRSIVWALGREATVYVPLPPSGALDFFARCLPFPWAPGSPQQTLDLMVGERQLGRIDLVGDWQDVRVPLPDDLPRNGLLTLRLRFAHAHKPLELGMSADPRSLAAAFSSIAVVPRSVAKPQRLLDSQSFDPSTGRITVPADGGVAVPLPRSSKVRLRLADAVSACAACRLEIHLSGPQGQSERIWRGAPSKARNLDVKFATDAQGFQRLWVRLFASDPGESESTVTLVLGEHSIEARVASGPPAASLPNVFVYMIDTLRADVLALNGGEPSLTPRMNGFAGASVTYRRARAPSSWTLPSVTSLLTGAYSDRHGVMEGRMQYDPERLPALQHLLGRKGYRTLGISQSFVVSEAYGLDAGFDEYLLTNQLNGWKLESKEARGLLALWLGQTRDSEPLFAYLHTVDPHAPYSPPGDFREISTRHPGHLPLEDYVPNVFVAKGYLSQPREVAHMRALYLDEVRHADMEFGRFLDLLVWLGLYEESFVVVVGDHGEEFVEHGGFEHGETLYDEALAVPLIIKYPRGKWAGERVDEAVSLVDVAPTLVGEIGASDEGAAFDGEVLPPSRVGGRRRPLFFEVQPARNPAWGQILVKLRGISLESIKCIENRAGVDRFGRPAPPMMAFDLESDPGEIQPLAAEAPKAVRCREVLAARSAAREREAKRWRSQRQATEETLERLRALGYLD